MTLSSLVVGPKKPYRPIVKLTIGQGDQEEPAQPSEIHITDHAGVSSDEFTGRFPDPERKIRIPGHRTYVDVLMGYEETGLFAMGRFEVGECRVDMPPRSLWVKGAGARWSTQFKAPMEMSYTDTTLGEILGQVAGRNGFTLALDPAYADTYIEHIDQNCSDAHFVTLLAERYKAIGKPDGEMLVFAERYSGMTVNEKLLTIPLDFSLIDQTARVELLQIAYHAAARGSYKGAACRYLDASTGEMKWAEAGGEPRKKILDREYPTAEEASEAAKAQTEYFAHQPARLQFTIPGEPAILSGAKLPIVGIDPDIDGEWIPHTVEHIYNESGYTTRVDAESKRYESD